MDTSCRLVHNIIEVIAKTGMHTSTEAIIFWTQLGAELRPKGIRVY